MPHCIVEYSRSIEPRVSASELMTAVYNSTLQSGLFEESHIRVRAMAYDYFQLGGQSAAFIHITVRLHQGRSSEQKKQLSDMVLAGLLALELTAVSLTVETVEMHTESYARRVVS